MKRPSQILLGRWRSDKRQTLKNFHRYHELTIGKKRIIGRIFGKLEFRFTPKYLYWRFDGDTIRESYEVLVEDQTSVVIRLTRNGRKKALASSPDDPIHTTELAHITFERIRHRQYFWRAHEGRLCEWFRKLEQ